MKLKLSIIIGCVAGMFGIVGGLTAFDDRYAKGERLIQVEYRLDQKIMSDRLFNLQERMWMLEDRYGVVEAQKAGEYRRLKQEMDLLSERLR